MAKNFFSYSPKKVEFKIDFLNKKKGKERLESVDEKEE
jgi:hypothetical protein